MKEGFENISILKPFGFKVLVIQKSLYCSLR